MPGTDREQPTARALLIASVLLTFASHVFGRRNLRPACSPGGLHPHCLDETAGKPLAPMCVYCGLAEGRRLYRHMDPCVPEAVMAEAAALAGDDAERYDLPNRSTAFLDDTAAFLLGRAAYDRMDAAVTA